MALGEWPEAGGGSSGREARRHRRLGIGASVLAFVLLVGIIHVSTFRVRHGTRVFSQQPWLAGQRTALRVVLFDLASRSYLKGGKIRASLTPEQGGKSIPLGEGILGASRSLEFTPLLPATLVPGRHRLRLEVQWPGEDPEVVQMAIEVRASSEPPDEAPEDWLVLRNVCEEGRTRKVEGGWAPSGRCKAQGPTRLYPESGTLVGNLENEVFLWSEAEGPPVTWRLRKAPPAPGLPLPPTDQAFEPIERDALGVGQLRLRPGYPRKRLELRVGDLEQRVWLRDLPTQILVRVEQGMQRADETFSARVFSMRRSVPLFLDLWIEGRWIGADSVMLGGSEGLRYDVALPAEASGLAVLRVSTSPDGAGGTGDERTIFIDSRAETAQGLRRLVARLSRLAPASDSDGSDGLAREPAPAELLALPPLSFARVERQGLSRAAALLLSRVELAHPGAPLLGDDTRGKRQAMEAHKRHLRRPLLAGLVALLGLVFSLVFVSVRRGRKQMRAKLLELEDEADGDEEGEPITAILSGGVGLPMVLMLILLISTLVGLIALFETLRWDRGM